MTLGELTSKPCYSIMYKRFNCLHIETLFPAPGAARFNVVFINLNPILMTISWGSVRFLRKVCLFTLATLIPAPGKSFLFEIKK